MISTTLLRRWRVPLLIFLTAVAIRATLAALMFGSGARWTGEAEWIGAHLARTGEFAGAYIIPTGPTAHCGPVYTSIVAVVYRVLGVSPEAEFVRIALLISAVSVCSALIPFVGSAVGLPRWAGVTAGFVSAVVPMHRAAELFHAWDEPYAAAGLMLAVAWLNTSSGLRENHFRAWALYGLFWGLLLHTMVTVLPVYIGLCGVNLLQVRTTRRAFRWLLAAAVSGLTLVPWTVRNRVELGDWLLVRSNLGIELRMAFGEGAGASTQDNLASGHYRNVHPSQSVAAATELRDEGEIAYNRRLSRQAAEWVAANEHRAGSLVAERIGLFWFGYWGNPETAWVFTLTTVLAAVGAGWMLRDGRAAALGQLGSVVLFFPVVYCVLQHLPRYRVPMWWGVLLLAAYGAGRTWQWATRARAAGIPGNGTGVVPPPDQSGSPIPGRVAHPGFGKPLLP